VQRNATSARDRWDPNAPGGLFNGPEGLPFDGGEVQYAWHVGIEHRVTQQVAFFGRAARSFRLPTVEERVASSPFGVATAFDLKTQTSHDVEGGIRASAGSLTWQISAYYMMLNNELFFSPATFTNTNLDPTKRYGVENIVTWRVVEWLRIKAGLAYTRSLFREGPFAGNDVPLVSPWTGSVAVSWDVYQKYLVLDAVVRFFSARRMDNDSANFQPTIGGTAVLDLRVGGEIDKFFWSVSVQKGMVVAPLHPDGLLTQLLPTDVVVLMLGVNDFSASAPLAVFEQFYRNLLGKTGELGVSIICVTPISAAKEDRRNALGLTLEAYRVAIRNLCSNAGLAVVEGPQLLPYDPRYYADGRHPAGLGALLLARRLAAAIRESVPSLREPQLAPGRYGAADFDAPPAPGNDALFE